MKLIICEREIEISQQKEYIYYNTVLEGGKYKKGRVKEIWLKSAVFWDVFVLFLLFIFLLIINMQYL